MSDIFEKKYKKPYDAAHKEHRAALARARYVRKCDRKREGE